MSGSELATRQDVTAAIDFDRVSKMGQAMARSGFFKDSRDEAQAVVKILAGMELGIPPVAAMRGIHVVEGKLELAATLLASLIKKHDHYDYRVIEQTDERCSIEFFEDSTSIGKSSWSIEDARRANLTGKDNWKKYPRQMLFARAMTEGQRTHCPDVAEGAVYAEGEIADEVGPDVAATVPQPIDVKRVENEAQTSGEAPVPPAGPKATPDTGPGAEPAVDDASSDPTSSEEAVGEQAASGAAAAEDGEPERASSDVDYPAEIARFQEQLAWKGGTLLKFAREQVGGHVVNAHWENLTVEDQAKLYEALSAKASE